MNIEIEQQTQALIDSLKATCGSYGLGNDGSEYEIIISIFLYKYLNDKFGFEAKKTPVYGARLSAAEKWDEEFDTFTPDEVEDLHAYLPAGTPRFWPQHTLAHLYNAQQSHDFGALLDSTLLDIAEKNSDIFSILTADKSKITIFDAVTPHLKEVSKRDQFALALITRVAQFNFEQVFSEKYDFFSSIFEYLIKDYNKDGGGKYAEYYTPRAVATIMARLLVPDNADLHSVTCYDPSAGTGTLLMALAHQIGETKCEIYSQDISQKSSQMLRLNIILNNLVHSLQNIVKGNTLTEPRHTYSDGTLRKFDFIVSNPPFNLDFSGDRNTIAKDSLRFPDGVPNIPKKKPDSMSIYLCFLQHVIYSLAEDGKAAIVVPTGFLTASSKNCIEKKIRERIVDNGWLRGVVTMPSNIFATTGTNVSVVFIDKGNNSGNAVLIDASKLGTTVKIDDKQRTILSAEEINQIVSSFHAHTSIDDFAVVKTPDEIKAKGYSFSAGQYFDIKIDYTPITSDEFAAEMQQAQTELTAMFQQSHDLENTIVSKLQTLKTC